MKKKYKISHEFDGSITVEIDHDIMTEEHLHQINNFWSGAGIRVRNSDGCVLKAVLKALAERVFIDQIYETMSLGGVISRFDFDKGNGCEGWPKMDGSTGIKIIDVENVYISEDDMFVREVA